MGYRWKPASGDWDRLRELELGIDRLDTASVELTQLIERTYAGLGFSSAEPKECGASEFRRREYVLEARRRIRDGSRRLGSALIAAGELRKQGRLEDAREQLRRVISVEPVLFYREIAESELTRLC